MFFCGPTKTEIPPRLLKMSYSQFITALDRIPYLSRCKIPQSPQKSHIAYIDHNCRQAYQCRIIFQLAGGLASMPYTEIHCEACVPHFAEALPPTVTFLQRYAIMTHYMPFNDGGCTICYKKKRALRYPTEVCKECATTHNTETARLSYVGLLCRELVGRDCGSVLAMILAQVA
jgi:hypothetical protein